MCKFFQFQINLEILILNVAPIIKRINKYQNETKPHQKVKVKKSESIICHHL